MNLNNSMYAMPPVVKNLLIINGLFFLAQNMLPYGLGHTLTQKLALYFWASPHFSPYQFITHMFLHGNLTHLFFNMFSLWMFGRILERDLGSKRFLIFYIVTGIGAAVLYEVTNWLQLLYLQSHGASLQEMAYVINVPVLGASGAIYGVLLGFGMMHPNSVIMLMFPPIPMKAKYFVVIFMVLEFTLGFTSSGNVAHFAHVTGMITAFFLLRYWKRTGRIY